MDEKITEFGKQLNAVQMKFIARPVLEVQSYEYAMIRLFTNLITREGEIHCLLQNGYADGAFSLSRSTHETIAIMDYLSANKTDAKLIKRFFDSIDIIRIKNRIAAIELCLQAPENKDELVKLLKEENANHDHYVAKYSSMCSKNGVFSDYWWAGKRSFKGFADKTRFPTNAWYKATCAFLHVNPFCVFKPHDGKITIGPTESGADSPLGYSVINLIVACAFMTENIADFDFLPEMHALADIIGMPLNIAKQKQT